MSYARIHAAFLLIVAPGCADNVAAPVPDAPGPPSSWMTAVTEGESWNPHSVTTTRHGDFVVFEGTAWPDGESTLTIRLTIRVDLGPGAQVINASNPTAADVMFRPWYDDPQGWTASGANGSGMVTLETLTSDRATGKFSFTAAAVTPTASPATYRVTNGSFDIRF